MFLSYAGQSLPAPSPGGISLELQPIDSAERNANGDMLLDEITLKLKISVKWKNLTGSDAHFILNTLRNNRTGMLTYFDVSVNSLQSVKVYYGAGAKIDYHKFDSDLNAQIYSNLSANFIEV